MPSENFFRNYFLKLYFRSVHEAIYNKIYDPDPYPVPTGINYLFDLIKIILHFSFAIYSTLLLFDNKPCSCIFVKGFGDFR